MRGRAVVVRASLGRLISAGRGRPEALVLDAGAFVAVERGDWDVVALIKLETPSGPCR